MASYQADIQIGVKGKAQLNQLESQLTRVNKAVKELNKALVLKTRAQTIKLNTQGAMSAIRELENRINRLGRTINVNLRVNEKEGKKAQSSGGTTVIASNPKAQSTALAAALASTKSLTIADQQRLQVSEQLAPKLQQQANLLKQIEIQTDKITKNRKEAQNIERGFGTKNRLNQLNFGYEALNQKLQRLKKEYKGVTGEVEKFGRTAERIADEEIIRNEKRRQRAIKRQQRVESLRQKRAQAQGATRAAGAGLGIAATQIPGLGGVASGALAGFAVGGPGGAAVGAAVAGVTELTAALTRFGAASAQFSNELVLSQRALANTVKTTEEYETALESIDKISKDFLIPIGDATQQFTKLNAAARANGVSIEEVTKVYRGLAAANLALGGNNERLQGILLATQQVFSKGKVQAEELRGQIGERLAGAFAKFAKSAGLSTQELDKALELGKISTEDFVEFTNDLLDRYEKDALRLSTAPELAGARLKLAMDDLKRDIGPLARDIGNFFLELSKSIVENIGKAVRAINRLRLSMTESALNGKIQTRDRAQQTMENLLLEGVSETNPRFGVAKRVFEKNKREAAELQKTVNKLRGEILPSGEGLPEKPKNEPKGKTAAQIEAERKAALRAQERFEFAERTLELEKALLRVDKEIAFAQAKGLDEEVISLEATKEILKIRKRLKDAVAGETDQRKIAVEQDRAAVAIDKVRFEAAQRLSQVQQEAGEKFTEELKEQLETRRQITQEFTDTLLGLNNEIELLGAVNEQERERIRLRQQLQADQNPQNGFTPAQISQLATARTELSALKQEQLAYNEALNQVQGPVSALTSGLRDVVSGTKTAQEAFADFLNTIANQLIQTAATMIAQYIAIGIARTFAGVPSATGGNNSFISSALNPASFVNGPFSKFGGTFAEGGTLGAGKWGIAGEAGPEIISGPATITPMSGGDTVVNIVVNTSGGGSTNSQGEKAKEAQALGRMVEASVVSIINREKRPGGILTR